MQVGDGWVVVLEEVGVFERVWFIWYILETLGLNLLPVVGGLKLHEHAVLLHLVD